ncbi:MAG: anti-sigma factor family protein [Candidatus Kryptoniota bacterium]
MGNSCDNFESKAHRPSADIIDGFVHGELGKDELREFEAHLTVCDECKKETESLRKLKGLLDTSNSYYLDETFNYKVVRNLKKEKRLESRREIRIALEDIVISLATLLAIVILGIQLFSRPVIYRSEMSGTLTNIEKSSVEQTNLSNDQVLELVLRGK